MRKKLLWPLSVTVLVLLLVLNNFGATRFVPLISPQTASQPFVATVYKVDCPSCVDSVSSSIHHVAAPSPVAVPPDVAVPSPAAQTARVDAERLEMPSKKLEFDRGTAALTFPMLECTMKLSRGLRFCQLQGLLRDEPNALHSVRAGNEHGYYLSASVIVRGAADTLHEFVIRNYLAGVDHFFIYDDGGGKEPVADVLGPLAALVTVEHPLNKTQFLDMVQRSKINEYGRELEILKSRQHMSMFHCFTVHGNETKWLISLDADEFLEAKRPDDLEPESSEFAGVPFMHRMLAKIEHVPAQMSRWNSVLTNNKLYPPVPYNLSLASMFPETCGFRDEFNTPEEPGFLFSGKSIVQPKYLDMGHYRRKGEFFIHGVKHWVSNPAASQELFFLEPHKKYRVSWNTTESEWTIVHYWSRSVSDYIVKQQRGRADGLAKRNLEELLDRELLCRQYDHMGVSQSSEKRRNGVETLLVEVKGRNDILREYYTHTMDKMKKEENVKLLGEFEEFLKGHNETVRKS